MLSHAEKMIICWCAYQVEKPKQHLARNEESSSVLDTLSFC